MKGKEMRVVVEVLSEQLQRIYVAPKSAIFDGRWSDVISYTVTDGKTKREPPGFVPDSMCCSLMSTKNWVRMPDCSDEWEVDVKLVDWSLMSVEDLASLCREAAFLKIVDPRLPSNMCCSSTSDGDLFSRYFERVVKVVDSSEKPSCVQDPSNSGSHCIDIKHHCSDYFPVISNVLEDLKTDADLIIGCLTSILQKQSSGALIEKAVKYQRGSAHFDSPFGMFASGRYGKKIITKNDVCGNYLPDEEEIILENPYEGSLLRGLSLAPPEFPKIACPWTRELPLEEKLKLFLGSFEREAIMPKSTNCIEGLNEQAMEYQRVFAHFDSPTLDASASDGKKVIQGNDVYRKNLVQGEENLYQVPPLAPPEFPRIEGPWTRELALAVMAISASAGYTTPSVIAKAFCAMAFAATATSFWLPGNWRATVRMLAKFGAIACIGGVLAAIGYGLPIECIWVGALAFLVPAVAVAFF